MLHISTRALFLARAKHDLYDSYYSYHSPVSTRAQYSSQNAFLLFSFIARVLFPHHE
jgi:hypothetical protein